MSYRLFFFFSFLHKLHSTALSCCYREWDISCNDSTDPSLPYRFQTPINISVLFPSLQVSHKVSEEFIEWGICDLSKFTFTWQTAQTKLIPGYYVWITLRCHVRLSSAKFKCLLKRYSISHSKAILAFLQNPRKWQFIIEASSAVDHESNWHPGYWSPSRVTSRENCQYQTIYSTRVSERRDECLPACFVCSNTNLRSEDLQY